MANFDFYDRCRQLEPFLSERLDPETAIRRFLKSCRRWFPEVSWAELERVDIRQDVAQLVECLTYILRTEPPRRIRAFWFGLFDAEVDGREYCGFYLTGSRRYRRFKALFDWFDWVADPAYCPEARYCESLLLTEIHRVTKLADNAGVSANCWGLLGCGAIIAAHLVRTIDRKLLLGSCRERAIVVGFNSAENILLGFIRDRSFRIRLPRRWLLPRIVTTPSHAHFYEVKDDGQGRWMLDHPLNENGRCLKSHFVLLGQAENSRLRLKTEILPDQKGKPVDFTFALLRVPIITDRVANLLARLAPGCVQRLPVAIAGRRGRYEVLNVIRAVECLDVARSKFIYRYKVDDEHIDPPRSIGIIDKLVIDYRKATGSELFRLGENTNHLIVSRRSKMQL